MPPNHSRGRGLTWSAGGGETPTISAPSLCTCCPTHGDELNAKLSHAIKQLGLAIEALAALTPKRPYSEQIVLSANSPWTIRDYSRRHLRVWVPSAVTVTISDLLTPMALSPGWNPFDVPWGSVVTVAAGVNVNARFEATDYDVQ